MYALEISRNYESYKIFDSEQNEVECMNDINCLEKKYLSYDKIDKDGNVVESPVKTMIIPAVVDLKKLLKKEKSNEYYKAYPYDKNLPVFIVKKKSKAGFIKYRKNQYVLINYKDWVNKHPTAIIKDTIGEINIENTLQYYLHVLNLKPIKRDKQKVKEIELKYDEIQTNNMNNELNKDIVDKRDEYVFTIDPAECKDYDDAISIKKVNNEIILSTYIVNIALYMDRLDAWELINKQVATYYTPLKNVHLLPEQLSEDKFSLCEGKDRVVLCYDFIIKDHNIIKTNIYPCTINVKHNFRYDEEELLKNNSYKHIETCLTDLESDLEIKSSNSHEVIETLMLLTNYYSALELYKLKEGIFRKSSFEGKHDITEWDIYKSSYCAYSEKDMMHEGVKLKLYCHITSPIRRLVDQVNQIILMTMCSKMKDKKTEIFVKQWINNIDWINKQTKAIKKLEKKILLLKNMMEEPDKEYKALIVSKEEKIKVWIKELNIFTTLYGEFNYDKLIIGKECNVKGYLFLDNCHEKIKCVYI